MATSMIINGITSQRYWASARTLSCFGQEAYEACDVCGEVKPNALNQDQLALRVEATFTLRFAVPRKAHVGNAPQRRESQ